MGWLKKALGNVPAGAPEAVGDLVGKALDLAGTRLSGDDQADFQLQKAGLLAESDKLQADLNRAGSSTPWRNAVGWTCAFSFAIMFGVIPFVLLVVAVWGTLSEVDFSIDDWKQIVNTVYDSGIMGGFLPVLMGMLGLAGVRVWEKKAVSPASGQRRKELRAAVKAHRKLVKNGMSDDEAEQFMERLQK